jgi:hypothetical protein
MCVAFPAVVACRDVPGLARGDMAAIERLYERFAALEEEVHTSAWPPHLRVAVRENTMANPIRERGEDLVQPVGVGGDSSRVDHHVSLGVCSVAC